MNKKAQLGFNFNPMRIKKEKPIRLPRVHVTKQGDRTTTPAQKLKLKKEAGFRCSKCGKKFDPRYLEVHHKKSVASHKHPLGWSPPEYSVGKKIKPTYDRKSNLQVICLKCHDGTKKKKRTTKKKQIPSFW